MAGSNSSPVADDDTPAQTGPGIPDEAASPGYDPFADSEREAEAHPPSIDKVFPPR